DVIGASHIGDVAVLCAGGDVAGVIEAAGHRRRITIGIVVIPGRQGNRVRRKVNADFSFAHAVNDVTGGGVDEYHRHTGQRPPHRAGLNGLTGAVSYRGGGFGLAVTITDRDVPLALHL